jgi:hypothetical protein
VRCAGCCSKHERKCRQGVRHRCRIGAGHRAQGPR